MTWVLAATENVGAAAGHAAGAGEPFDAGKTIIEHVANDPSNPIIRLPEVFGIDFSITKHVFMLWVVALVVFVAITWIVRRHQRAGNVPTRAGVGLEMVVTYIRDSIVLPNVGAKWVRTWAPLVLTLFFFIFTANLIGLLPVFDLLKLANHYLIHADMHHSVFGRLLEGGTTATANFNVTVGLALITFFAIIIAGSKANGFINHWKNIVPHGLPWPIYIILVPIEIMGMLVKPFALTMRLAANMTGGHIAILALLSLIFLLAEMAKNALVGIAVGLVVATPLAVGISGLELIVVLVQAYVFTLLTAVFIGLVIHVHH
ncbi:MAG: F0F1 ATP synthase subunit A [Acidobacteriota bacterium]|jgi:F-type H+-transporting ATPase subunit a|nr:F0F1 ATP synthase subunit A [Acidobacteriota bacterium]